MQFGCWCRCYFGVQVTVRAHFCKIDGRVLGSVQSGVLAKVLFWDGAWGAV